MKLREDCVLIPLQVGFVKKMPGGWVGWVGCPMGGLGHVVTVASCCARCEQRAGMGVMLMRVDAGAGAVLASMLQLLQLAVCLVVAQR